MANRFYTIMIVPEKTSQVRKFVIPAWIAKGAAAGAAFVLVLAIVMVLDYWYVMNQISENKNLKMENRRLKQQVQVFQNKMATIENTLDRVKTFATRLKVITNIEERGSLLQSVNEGKSRLPDATANISNAPDPAASASLTSATAATAATGTPGAAPASEPTESPAAPNAGTSSEDLLSLQSPEESRLRREYDELDGRFTSLNHDTLFVEQMLQDEYELLADQKSFLAALPTRKPAVGYFTSGFGVRRSPFGGRTKMHEGLDIANRPGTLIKAPADGVVVLADTKAGYGQTVILDHGYGVETWYGHTKKVLVNKGQKVRRGDSIALLGNTGRSTGPHVHYEVRVNGTPVNPLSYILEN